MPHLADKDYMKEVLNLAQKGWGRTKPNPLVGAILVKNNKIIGCGYHKGPGRKHAEIEAINSASTNPKNSTLYVNLEPCCHTGRTGPCTDVIIKAGIKKVVYSHNDPNPLVNGKGLRQLKKAGLETIGNIIKNEALQLNEIYLNQFKNKRPFVILKLAVSLDGQIATANGDSKYISSQKALKFVHQLRSQVDAVLIGARTALTDNPALTTRFVKGSNPYRIIAAYDALRLKNINLLQNNKDHKTIIVSTERSLKKLYSSKKTKNLISWSVSSAGKKLSPSDILKKAKAYGIESILLEGGGQLAASFIKEQLVDKIIFISSPIILGSGTPSIGDMNIKSISDGIEIENISYKSIGRDLIVSGYPKGSK